MLKNQKPKLDFIEEQDGLQHDQIVQRIPRVIPRNVHTILRKLSRKRDFHDESNIVLTRMKRVKIEAEGKILQIK